MKITYIGHSGFCIELNDSVLVFDYYEGTIPEFTKDKQIYFFVSHKHSDHFSFAIFEYANRYEKVTYILSNDIKMNEKYMERKGVSVKARTNIIYAKKNSVFELDQMKVRTLTSTDEGVAYMIEVCETKNQVLRLYHAGDLNWWTWDGETKEEYDHMKKRFLMEMQKIEGEQFDLAFVVLDPRQKERFYWGFDYFMKHTRTKHVFPMHCWEDYSVIGRMIDMEESKNYRDRIEVISERGQEFTLK